ncbi:MAG: GNAT family N-acetyltransferase [Sandaracinaceae bacterium]
MHVRPIGAEDAPSLLELGARPEVAELAEHVVTVPLEHWRGWIGEPDPDRVVTLGAFEGTALLGAARLTIRSRRRQAHCGWLEVIVPPDGDAALDALLAQTNELCDRWLQVTRVRLRVPAEHPWDPDVLARRGYVQEGVRRRAILRGGRLADELQLARVDPSIVTANRGPSFALPPKGPPVRATFRAVRVEDGPATAAMYNDPLAAWGTLQIPAQPRDTWTKRFATNDPLYFFVLVAEVEGTLAGTGAVIGETSPRRRHSAGLGMAVAAPFQGRTVGRQLLDALVALSDQVGFARLELEVWTDNERARRIYEATGFEDEGVARAGGFRDGAYVDDLAMARLRG